jgi:hypothetical protein
MSDVGRPEIFHALAWLGAALLVALVVALRRLARRAALEEAEEVLRAEFRRLDDEGDR